jgi:hypothetical protein
MHASPNTAAFHPHFAPWLAAPEQLWRTLVGHHDLLREFLARLQATEEGATANHLLLVGPRGIGKTHLLCLVDRCVSGRLHIPQDWSGPSKAWTSVFFAEEEYAGQNSLANFLLNLLDKLREALPAEQLWNLPPNLHQQTDQAVIDCCFERMERFDRERGGRILLVIDNLQKVLQQWHEEEHLRLRSFLSRNSLLVILGSAPSVFKEVMDQKAAFHDFFEIRILPELSNEQVLELLARRFEEDGRLSEFEARRAELSKKIPAIEILTGGNPRLVLFLYQIATRSAFLDIELALRNLLEELREYFVRRFDELPDQARKVLDTIAQMSGPATPTEIAEAARLRLALVNAQLKRLKEGHYVRPAKFQRQKATRYDITERLFRIWRQTATVAGRQRFRFLADFLKLYFTPEEIRALYSHHEQYLRAALDLPREEVIRHVDELFYFQAAAEGPIRYGAFFTRMESLMRIGELRRAEEEAEYFAAESLEHQDTTGVAAAYNTQAEVHLQTGQRLRALEDIERLIAVGGYQQAASAAEKLLQLDRGCAEGWALLGMAVGNMGDHARALEKFHSAAESRTPNAALWTNQAIALNRLNRWAEALYCAEQAVALDAGFARAWEELGVAAADLGQYERALEAFRKTAAMGGPTAALWTNQAGALDRLGRGQEALRCAEQAVALDPSMAFAWEALGAVANNLGQHERALQAFRRAVEVSQPTVALWTNQAIALNGLGRRQEALQCAERAIALDEKSARAHQELGVAVANLKQHERALEAFRKAAELSEPTAALWTNQAITLNSLGRREEALRCAEQAVGLDQKSARTYQELGVAAANLGQHERALEAFRKAADVSEPTAALWTNQAIALHRLGRSQEALLCAEQAVALDEKSAPAHQQLGVAAGSLRQHERALEAFRKAADVSGPAAALWTNQAIALNNLGRREEALWCAEQAVALDPSMARGWEQLGVAASSLGQHERALGALCKAAELGKPRSAVLTLQAKTLRHLGRHQEALGAMDAALALEPGSANSWQQKAWVLSALERFEDSLECVERARQHGANDRDYHHDRGDLLLLSGQFQDALGELEAGLELQRDDWDLQADRLIALGCLGQQGPSMEALPVALAQVQIPPEAASTVHDFMHEIGLNCLRRGEDQISRGLFAASLGMESWQATEWFGKQVGNFLRRVLDVKPGMFQNLARLLAKRVRNEGVLRLLDPFLKASDLLQSKDLTILEKLFPEVRELVLDIVRRVDPELHGQLKRLT